MATMTDYVRTDEASLASAVGRGVRACASACAAVRGHASLPGLRVAVQGCGAIGAAVAAEMAAAGATLLVADINPAAADAVATETGATVVDPMTILAADVDILMPCATGGVVNQEAVEVMRAWSICGAANNILADASVGIRLHQREILFVPDFIASAGAVVAGICALQGRSDAETVIENLGTTTRTVLEEAAARGLPTTEIAIAMAEARRLE
jgi:leucine dehydrogenase